MKAEEKTTVNTKNIVDDGGSPPRADFVARFDTDGPDGPSFEISIGGEVVDLSSFARMFARNLGART